MKITKIEQQKNNPRRYSVFLDGDYGFGIHESILIKTGLHPGDTVSFERMQDLERRDEVFRAREAAFKLLQYRDRSMGELRRRLRKKSFPDPVIETVIEELEEKGYLDDREFAMTFAEDQLTRKNIGPIRLRAELGKKRVSDAIIDDVVHEIYQKYDVLELALAAARKKAGSLKRVEDRTAYRRLTSYLARRGFSRDVINRVVDEVWPGR